MELFNKLFGKSGKKDEPSNNQKEAVQHAPDWDHYFSNMDDIPGSIMIDLGLYKVAPIADKSNVVWVSVKMKAPTEDGFSSSEESDLLYEIEDELVGNLTNRHNSVYVGRLTSEGKRNLYFYFDHTTLYDKTIAQAMGKFPSYEFDHGTKTDKTWDAYFNFLYPMPHQFQMILNARVIRNLERSDDNLTAERMVDHWVYFKNEQDTDNYIAEITKLNFKVFSNKMKETTNEFKYEINIGRIDKADYYSVNEYVLDLWELARKHNGLYDGWGCPIVKN